MRHKVLITGASGFLGYHLINAALENDLEVYAAVRKSSNISHLADMPINFTELNYADVEAMEKIFEEKEFDYVIHAAGTTKALTLQEYDLVNNTYTQNLAKAAEKNKGQVKRFVFISSLAATGPSKNIEEKINDSVIPYPVTAYGKSKLNAELGLKNADIPVTILRPTAIYGPREKDIFIVTQTLNKGFDPYIGKFLQKLSFVYAKDMAKLAVNALGKTGAFSIYNISDGREYSRYEYADIIKALLGKKALRFHLPLGLVKAALVVVDKINRSLKKVSPVSIEKLNELTAANWSCDISKAQKELDFAPQYDLQKGLEESLEWYKKNNWLK
ncbi:MAG: NAD(P)-dependent oxidoreductase [Chitinophagaceae bacterium]|nr:NAD(P)-dependent oxidoreductase [Chitinophagaceae bacterium]